MVDSVKHRRLIEQRYSVTWPPLSEFAECHQFLSSAPSQFNDHMQRYADCTSLCSWDIKRFNEPRDNPTLALTLNRADLNMQRIVWQRSAQDVWPTRAS